MYICEPVYRSIYTAVDGTPIDGYMDCISRNLKQMASKLAFLLIFFPIRNFLQDPKVILFFIQELFVAAFGLSPAPQWRPASPEPGHIHHHGWPQRCPAWLQSSWPDAVRCGVQRSCHGPSPGELYRGRRCYFYITGEKGSVSSLISMLLTGKTQRAMMEWSLNKKKIDQWLKRNTDNFVSKSYHDWKFTLVFSNFHCALSYCRRSIFKNKNLLKN